MIKRLDNTLLNSIKQPTQHAKRFRVYDSLVSGLFALVATKSICFYVTVRQDGKRKAVNLGRFPIVSVEAARSKAIALLTGNQHKPTSFELLDEAGAASGETLSELLSRYVNSKQLSDATKHSMDSVIKRVMPTLTNEQQLSIMIALCTGLRKSELQSITLSRLDNATQSIKLARTKNGKPHQIPLPAELWRQLIEGSKNKSSDQPLLAIGSHLPKAFTRVIPLSFHDCRRTAASTLIQLGEPESLVKSLLNHTDSKNVTQAHYLRFDREQIRQAVDKLLNYFSY